MTIFNNGPLAAHHDGIFDRGSIVGAGELAAYREGSLGQYEQAAAGIGRGWSRESGASRLGDTSDVRSPTSTEVRSPTSTSTEVRSPTSTSTEVRSPTSTSTEVRSPTSTTTDAYTAGNVTVTGGAGAGATHVTIYGQPSPGSHPDLRNKSRGARPSEWVPGMMQAVNEPRVQSPMQDMFAPESARAPFPGMMREVNVARAPTPMTEMMRSASSGLGAVDASGKVLLVAGIVGIVAAGVYFATRKKKAA